MPRTPVLPARLLSRCLLALFALTALRAASCPDAAPPIDELFPCQPPEGDGACGDGWHCARDQRWLADRYSEHGWCLQDCTVAADCPTGYVCERDGCVAEEWLDCRGRPEDAAPWAEQQEGICQGARQICDVGAGRWAEPDYASLPYHEATERTCAGHDTDCDGAVDEELQPPAADRTAGVCVGQTRTCAGESGWQEPDYTTIEGYEADEERCDGLDNDCDGQTDRGLQPPAADRREGVCATAVKVCAGESGWQEPDYTGLLGYEELEASCDGQDNDCDGLTDLLPDGPDEGVDPDRLSRPCYTGAGETRGQGACQDGTQACDSASGRWVDACLGETLPVTERCSGHDDDCDGATDEDLEPPVEAACLSLGVCLGTQPTCTGAPGWTCPYPATWEEHESLCDGLDNDCDGATDLADEDVQPPADLCLTEGVCAGTEPACGAELGWSCPYPDTHEQTELCCDGLDNDCDGLADQVPDGPDDDELPDPLPRPCYDGPDGTLDVGECHAGVQLCLAQQWGLCEGEQQPTDEACDGLDNDCDTSTDEAEDLVPPAADLQAGLCVGQVQVCQGESGWQEPDYTAIEGYEQQEQSCDGLDNDCDGTPDDPGELPAPLAARQQGVCAGSVQACAGEAGWQEPDYATLNGYEEAEVSCDGRDNNCDGDLLPEELDEDGDGVPACHDCDDDNSMVHPAQQADPAWGANTNQQDRWPVGRPERAAALDLCADADDWDCSDGGVLRDETCGSWPIPVAAPS